MATPRNLHRAPSSSTSSRGGRPGGDRMPPKQYVRTAPKMPDKYVIGARLVEAQYAARELSRPKAGRCCGRCKTPYNCGNPECRCHGAEREYGTRD